MNAIITAATGYEEKDLHPFLSSVQRHCPETTVFLLAFHRHQARVESMKARYPFVTPVLVPYRTNRGVRLSKWIARHFIPGDYFTCSASSQKLGRRLLHVTLQRFFFALEIVRTSGSRFDNVLLTDSRDVVLQSNPFEQVGDRLISGLEEITIGSCPHNAHWIEQIYGKSVLDSMSSCRIVCSGVTLGPTGTIEAYLAAMCAEIWRRLAMTAASPYFDQSVHNYLIRSGQISPTLTENRNGIIATLFYEDLKNVEMDEATGRLVVCGQIPAIAHQYDRHASLAEFVRSVY